MALKFNSWAWQIKGTHEMQHNFSKTKHGHYSKKQYPSWEGSLEGFIEWSIKQELWYIKREAASTAPEPTPAFLHTNTRAVVLEGDSERHFSLKQRDIVIWGLTSLTSHLMCTGTPQRDSWPVSPFHSVKYWGPQSYPGKISSWWEFLWNACHVDHSGGWRNLWGNCCEMWVPRNARDALEVCVDLQQLQNWDRQNELYVSAEGWLVLLIRGSWKEA